MYGISFIFRSLIHLEIYLCHWHEVKIFIFFQMDNKPSLSIYWLIYLFAFDWKRLLYHVLNSHVYMNSCLSLELIFLVILWSGKSIMSCLYHLSLCLIYKCLCSFLDPRFHSCKCCFLSPTNHLYCKSLTPTNPLESGSMVI